MRRMSSTWSRSVSGLLEAIEMSITPTPTPPRPPRLASAPAAPRAPKGSVRIQYLLSLAGQRWSLLHGGDGQRVQIIDAPVSEHLLELADIGASGDAVIDATALLKTSDGQTGVAPDRFDKPGDATFIVAAERARRQRLLNLEKVPRESREPSIPIVVDLPSMNIVESILFALAFVGLCASWLWIDGVDLKIITNPLIFMLVCYGLTSIVVESGISKPLRDLVGQIPLIGRTLYDPGDQTGPDGLLACPRCVGTWVGAMLPLLGVSAFALPAALSGSIAIAVHGFIGSAVCWILHIIAERLER